MYANGSINITLSILSSIPPCPGMMSPKSFIPQYLFILDAAKSPICPIKLKTIVIIAIFNTFKSTKSGMIGKNFLIAIV